MTTQMADRWSGCHHQFKRTPFSGQLRFFCVFEQFFLIRKDLIHPLLKHFEVWSIQSPFDLGGRRDLFVFFFFLENSFDVFPLRSLYWN